MRRVFFESGLEISNFMRKIQQAYVMYYRKSLSPDSLFEQDDHFLNEDLRLS